MKRRSRAGRAAAVVIAVLLSLLLVKLLGYSFWKMVLYFILSLFAGDFIAEWLEKRGLLGRKR